MTAIQHRPARSIADLDQGTILATVDIAAPAARIFEALASQEIAQWWGHEGIYQTREWSGDVRVGGRWRAAGVGADGEPFRVEGEYTQVDPPHHLAHTWRAEWDGGSETHVSYDLEPIEGGTRLTLRHRGFTNRESCARHGDGWALVLDWLSAHVAPRKPPTYAVIRLIPPRPTFAASMTDAEREIMNAHVMYWSQLLHRGTAVAFGPVADPSGDWGLGVVEVDTLAAIADIEANDPAIRSNKGFRYEVLPMLTAIVRPQP